TPFERSANKNTTATYAEAIAYYQQLDKIYDQLKLIACGPTDIGKPLHLAVLSKNKIFDPSVLRQQNKRIILINNGIHPGEPEGIDASMMLVRDLLKNNLLPDNVVLCFIPIYNIDGSLNRSSTSRANQNGPEAYGFRGNAQNLDLNRDFIKTDSENSRSFQQIFNTWQPDIFVDNHTSNGADYQYTMTLIDTQQDKLSPILANFMTNKLTPALFKGMKAAGWEMTPYVDHVGETPDSGIEAFLEIPRFSTGYAALHQTMGYVPETHMLKPFGQRVQATYELMKCFIKFAQENSAAIAAVKKQAAEAVKQQTEFALNWKLDQTKVDSLSFKGFEAGHKPSGISGETRLYYDRTKPFQKNIPWFKHYEASLSVTAPKAYIIPQAWQKVIDLLKLNGVKMQQLPRDTVLDLEMYYITDYKSPVKPYEGHYLHTQVMVKPVRQTVRFYAGDYMVNVDQTKNRYIVETLEPQGVDSFFAWNFFDAILGQKEYFSNYVFEDTGAEILNKNPELRKQLEEEKSRNPALAKSGSAQLDWVYRHSDYLEKTFMRYPIGRVVD
ncbi:MAG: M14 family metallopeptidase, partial [Sphingobacteriaceae bacterium]